MKKLCRFVMSFILILGLTASYTPTLADKPVGEPVDPLRPAAAGSAGAFSNPQAAVAEAATVPLGKPGLSYSYAKTYGTKNSFYLEDASHLNSPSGVFATADGVWVVEEHGMRALKYNPAGQFASQIGEAGHRYMEVPDQSLSIESLEDAAVDSEGNLWLANSQPGTVLEFDINGQFLQMLGVQYNSGPGNDRFNNPTGIAFDPAGNLYVSDWNNQRVQVFDIDAEGKPVYINTIGVTGAAGSDNAHFNSPARIAIDSGSRLYVADQQNQRVQIFDVSNPLAVVYVGTLGTTGEVDNDNNHFCYPQGVGVDAALIYVADTCNQRVQVFNRATLAYVATLGTLGNSGPGNNQFSEPFDVSIDPSGLIYVADYFNERVQVFNSSRVYARTLGTTGVPYLTDSVHFNRPAGVAVGADGSIYLVEDYGQRLVKLDPNGNTVWTRGVAGVGLPEWRKDPAHLSNPRDVAVSPANGNIYVINTGNSDIRIYSPSGVLLGTVGLESGQGNTQFSWPNGIFIAADGKLYVADSNNQRVQILSASGAYITTLSVNAQCSDNPGKFCNPDDVVVDSKGNIYVAESGNARVQMFNSSFQYVRTLGVTGNSGGDYGYLSGPSYLAVDRSDNVYISSTWDHTVHMYDPQGAFLGVLGGGGSADSQLANGSGLAFGPDGSLYVADYDHARVVRYNKGYPNWQQRNITGFGMRWNSRLDPMAAYKDHLYLNSSNGDSRLLVMDTNGVWTADTAGGWGGPISYVTGLSVFQDNLYASVFVATDDYTCTGLMLKRFDGAVWSDIVTGGFGGQANACEVDYMQAFNHALYAVVWMSNDPISGDWVPAQLWSSPSGDAGSWAKVSDLPMMAQGISVQGLYAFDNALYLATVTDSNESGQVWRSTDGVTWNAATEPNMGNPKPGYAPVSFTAYQGYLYVGVRNYNGTGAQLWRCQSCADPSGWQMVTGNGFEGVDANGDTFVDNYRIEAFAELDGYLIAGVANTITGMQVWRSADGYTWNPIATNGFGYNDTRAGYVQSSAILNDQLFFSAANFNLGVQIWAYNNKFVFLPIVRR